MTIKPPAETRPQLTKKLKIRAHSKSPGHLEFLRQDAKKQENINEPIIPYSTNSLNQVTGAPMYQAVTTKFFALPGPLPTSNDSHDAVSNCSAVSLIGATNRPKALA